MPNCPKCNAALDPKAKFCGGCGAKIEAPKPKSKPEQKAKTPPPSKLEKNQKKSGKNTKLWIIISVLGVLIVVLAVVAFYVIFRKDDDGSSAKDKFDQLANTTVNQNVNTNLNANTSTNENQNLNTNANANENANTNTSANQNQNANANSNTNLNTDANANTNTSVQGAVNPVRPDRGQTTVTASSTLLDTTGIGFDYSPDTAIDQDFSTAWTEDVEDEGAGEWIKLQFPSTATINTVGIVPGYGRDSDIYFENNRIKDLELGFSDGSTVTKQLPDDYKMHFIEFSTVETDYLKLTVKGVYDGSKYDDTCVAELDIWSDYVLNKDVTAAMNYYLTHKEPYAVRPEIPSTYINQAYMAIGIMGGPTPEIEVWSYSPAMEPMIAAAEIPAATPAGQTFTAKWYSNDGTMFKSVDITSYSATAGLDTITISSTANISDLLDPPHVLWPIGSYKVEWYENNTLSQTIEFPVNAQ